MHFLINFLGNQTGNERNWPAEILWGLKVGGKTGEEIGAKSRGVIGIGKWMLEMASELVEVGGEAWWTGGIDECATCLGQNWDHLFGFGGGSYGVVWWNIAAGFRCFVGSEWRDKRRWSFAWRNLVVVEYHLGSPEKVSLRRRITGLALWFHCNSATDC